MNELNLKGYNAKEVLKALCQYEEEKINEKEMNVLYELYMNDDNIAGLLNNDIKKYINMFENENKDYTYLVYHNIKDMTLNEIIYENIKEKVNSIKIIINNIDYLTIDLDDIYYLMSINGEYKTTFDEEEIKDYYLKEFLINY